MTGFHAAQLGQHVGPAVPPPGGQAALQGLAFDRDVGAGLVLGMQGTIVARQAVLAESGQHQSGGGPQDGGQQPARIRGPTESEPHTHR